MKESFAIIILLGIIAWKLFEKYKLPGLLGMLLVGIILGPYSLNLLNENILVISTDLRLMALVVILIRAGLGIRRETLREIGPEAIKLSFLPGLVEGLTIGFLSTKLLDFTFVQGGILGFILAAVSPAVVVPSMIELMEKGLGSEKNIPTLILSGASMDDVFAITMFTSFMGLYGDSSANIFKELIKITTSILLGIGFGLILGIGLYKLFEFISFSLNEKILIIFGVSILFTYLENSFSIASLIGVMVIGIYLGNKDDALKDGLEKGFSNIWVLGQILLFVLIGASVDLTSLRGNLLSGSIIIFLGLLARSLGVYLSLIGSNLNNREKLFCSLAYIPKATVQAAMGVLPLAAGVAGGEVILSISVLSIVITAPLGAILIKKTANKLLT